MVRLWFRKQNEPPKVDFFKNKFAFEKCIDEAGDKVVVVDFNAHWCPPCKYFNPKFQEMSLEYEDIIFKKCSVE